MSTIPQRLDKYELIERLGHGGVAEVWKAFDTQLQRHVAIKVLHPDLRSDPTFLRRFQREAQMIAGIHHPNIVELYDFQIHQQAGPNGEGGGQPIAYMVMDYIEGPTLAEYIHATSGSGNIPRPEVIVNLFTSMSLAVDYAHRQGMVHRDIKPANILLDQHNTLRNPMGEPMLTDFGVATLLNTVATLHTGIQFGTPAYIAPEQIRGQAGSERSDLYALGVILYEIVTGVLPFHGDSPVDVMQQQLDMTPITPSLINPHLPPALVQVIMRALMKDPMQRYSSAASLTAAIARAMSVPVPEALGLPPPTSSDASLPTLRINPTTGDVANPVLHSAMQQPRLDEQIGVVERMRTGEGRTTMTPYGAPATPSIQPHPRPQPPTSAQRPRGLLVVLVALLILVLLGGAAAWVGPQLLATGPLVGQAFYTSSGLETPGTTFGLSDQLQIDLQNVPTPAEGKSYYVWLLGDERPGQLEEPPEGLSIKPPLLVTDRLPVNNGKVQFVYQGLSNHENLLSATSRLLITEEEAGRKPSGPSTDRSTWRYFARVPQDIIPGTKLSALLHIRHLLYHHLRPGGIDNPGGGEYWLTRNTQKILEWAVAARDSWYGEETSDGQIEQMRAHFIRILDFIDGPDNVHLDLPPNTPVLVSEDDARGGLLTVDPARQGPANPKNPPGHLDHTQYHAGQVARAKDVSEDMRVRISHVLDALKNAKGWLEEMRTLARELYKKIDADPAQMRQSESGEMLDNLVTKATYAYIGQLDPGTNEVRPGVIQAHYDMRKLAVLTITRDLPEKL